jgi:hypothetical protein
VLLLLLLAAVVKIEAVGMLAVVGFSLALRRLDLTQ